MYLKNRKRRKGRKRRERGKRSSNWKDGKMMGSKGNEEEDMLMSALAMNMTILIQEEKEGFIVSKWC